VHKQRGEEEKEVSETAYTWVQISMPLFIILFRTKFPDEIKKWSIPPTQTSLPRVARIKCKKGAKSTAINILETYEGQCRKNRWYQLLFFLSLFSARLAVLFCGSRTRACWKSG